ncbi:hypothetical protein DPMN_108741 [Dreissena polymorpha]|uniref:RING-type domain-containing protein n=1 Tax=Dreissena polymorpha TaxID=45954 RepID=A0A9D4QMD2_DREPO|nr:hypothetical protein DPMN_108741 [Dreissena polymorpha]
MSASTDATVPGLPENLICCPICKKTLKALKCLPCLHLVCLKCLNVHIFTCERKKSHSFPCPVCGEPTQAPSEELKPEKWAKHFTSNSLIDSIDAVQLKNGDRKFDPCRNTRKRSLASRGAHLVVRHFAARALVVTAE